MKKSIYIICIALIVLIVIFASMCVVDHAKMRNNEPVVFSTWWHKYTPAEITSQAAIDAVKKTLDKKSIETITNFDNPKVEEVVFDSNPFIIYFGEKVNLVGKQIYKITFNTTSDGLLGPLVFYVDKLNGKLIGANPRF